LLSSSPDAAASGNRRQALLSWALCQIKTPMDRETAKIIIARSLLPSLTDEEINNILSEYWRYESIVEIKEDIQSKELPALTEQAISIMVSTDSPSNLDKRLFEPLVIDFLVFDLKYSSNKYLENKLSGIGQPSKVSGTIETAGKCPCCMHLSIDPGEDGLWAICPVCFWENGGDGPNHMGLSEARNNFESFGAINKSSLEFVDPEGTIKYPK